MDLNHGPRPYQGRALTELSYGPNLDRGVYRNLPPLGKGAGLEMPGSMSEVGRHLRPSGWVATRSRYSLRPQVLTQLVRSHMDRQPLLIVGSYRDSEVGPSHPLAHTINELTPRQLLARVLLNRLSGEDVTTMVAGLADQEPPSDLIQVIQRETEGNPFSVEEVYLHLRESGALFDDQGRFKTLHWQPHATGVVAPRTSAVLMTPDNDSTGWPSAGSAEPNILKLMAR